MYFRKLIIQEILSFSIENARSCRIVESRVYTIGNDELRAKSYSLNYKYVFEYEIKF
ncbi:hypothetical protein [Thomasclavelia saccharogumia]|uniref:hypothetical protein n=1 Tax=Thomasclavelia saccharogumia TaxID=341225 RepID=UPI000B2BBB7C|nr:hypothetical protein [Thomasclavelia saccharogumia]